MERGGADVVDVVVEHNVANVIKVTEEPCFVEGNESEEALFPPGSFDLPART
jgi:hypothetical protein